MSKNITIQEGDATKIITGVNKLSTALMNSNGRQNWIPEDESVNYIKLGSINITENGTYTARDGDCDAFSEVEVNVEGDFNLITKTVTENGTYNASDDDADGYSQITVNVSGGGGGIGDYYYPWEEHTDTGLPYGLGLGLANCFYNGQWNIFALDKRYTLSGNTWSESTPGVPYGNGTSGEDGIVVYNNEICAVGAQKPPSDNYDGFYVLRNGAWEALSPVPNNYAKGVVVHDGAIYCLANNGYAGGITYLYKYDGTWHNMNIQAPGVGSIQFYDGVLYLYVGGSDSASGFYKLNGQTFEKLNINIPFYSNFNIHLFEDEGKLHAIGKNWSSLGDPGFHYSYNKHWWRIEEQPTEHGQYRAIGFDGKKSHFLSYNNNTYVITHATSEIVKA